MDSIINSIQIIIFNVCACKLSIENSLGKDLTRAHQEKNNIKIAQAWSIRIV